MKVAKLLAMAAVVGLVSYALVAAEGDAPKKERPKGIYGKIVKADDKAVTVKTKVKDGEGKEVTIAIDDKTVVMVDKKEAKAADLKADMMCFVTPETASDKVAAEKISAWTPKPKPEK
jgi:hypothetical protein